MSFGPAWRFPIGGFCAESIFFNVKRSKIIAAKAVRAGAITKTLNKVFRRIGVAYIANFRVALVITIFDGDSSASQ